MLWGTIMFKVMFPCFDEFDGRKERRWYTDVAKYEEGIFNSRTCLLQTSCQVFCRVISDLICAVKRVRVRHHPKLGTTQIVTKKQNPHLQKGFQKKFPT